MSDMRPPLLAAADYPPARAGLARRAKAQIIVEARRLRAVHLLLSGTTAMLRQGDRLPTREPERQEAATMPEFIARRNACSARTRSVGLEVGSFGIPSSEDCSWSCHWRTSSSSVCS